VDEQAPWVLVESMRWVPGLEEQVAVEVVDEIAGSASGMGVDRIVEVGTRARRTGFRLGGG
jgi:hypothetical protein